MGRAAQLEATTPTQAGAMTLGGVEALGAEVGIAADRIREAATLCAPLGVQLARSRPMAQQRNRWLNGPTRIALERVMEGELPESEYAHAGGRDPLPAQGRRPGEPVGPVVHLVPDPE